MAFPFNLPGARVRVDEGGAIVVPDGNQLDGSCRDFIGAHSAVDIANGTLGIALATLDAPLLELGAITDERQDPKTRVRSWRTTTAVGSTIYAYLLNNYWHTNYKADQEGRLAFRFVLRPHAGSPSFGPVELRRFGADNEQPLLVRPVTATSPRLRMPFRFQSAGVIVSSLRAERGGAVILRVYNPSQRSGTARIVGGQNAAIRVSVAEGDRKTTTIANGSIVLKPFATAIVRVVPVRNQGPGQGPGTRPRDREPGTGDWSVRSIARPAADASARRP